MVSIQGRALHYVFKIPERTLTAHFYRKVLEMKVLRHEEFSEGCEATCNGPYANRWSKTMVGYGPEDTHFALELTYNYPIDSYEMGNDFIGITIKSKEILERAKTYFWPILPGNILEAPGGYQFYILDEPEQDHVVKVTLASSNLDRTINFWNKILGLKIFDKTDDSVLLGFDEKQVKLEFKDIGKPVEHAQAYGRIAFSCPNNQQEYIDKIIKENNQKILTPLISLDTPGKATVRVIILADPDGHEICFVDDENFRQLSQVEPDAEEMLYKYLKHDKIK